MRLKLITSATLDETSGRAALSNRLRMNYNFHELTDSLQRMLNAIEPGSYIQPHRHFDPAKVEVFIILRGKASAFLFDEEGVILDSQILSPTGENPGVEFTPGQFHTIVSLEPGTVLFEAKDGPYEALTDKDFAAFAPPPEDKEGADIYLKKLKEYIELS